MMRPMPADLAISPIHERVAQAASIPSSPTRERNWLTRDSDHKELKNGGLCRGVTACKVALPTDDQDPHSGSETVDASGRGTDRTRVTRDQNASAPLAAG